MNKKELITKIINNLKKFKKNKLIDIYNNYLIKNIKGGGHGMKVKHKPNKAVNVKVNSNPDYIPTKKTSPEKSQNLFNFGNQTTQQQTDIFQFNPQERTEIFQSKVPFQQQPTDMNKKNVIVYEQKGKSSFNKFKDENRFYEEMYNKEVTYQHNYDSFKLFTILKHMLNDKKKYLSDYLQIFQTIDAYYIRDVLEFVKNYFKNYKINNIKFSYEIKKNKIFYRLNQHFGIMIYNKPFNTLDIYLKKTNTNTNQPQQQVQQQVQQQQQQQQQPRQVTPKTTILPNQTVNRDTLRGVSRRGFKVKGRSDNKSA
jgi:hypothetical protein